jgi:hypothetical protein
MLTSLDAITWTSFSDFSSHVPRERLNVVGFVHDRFLTPGERDFALSLELPLRTWGVNSHQLAPAGWWRAFATGLGRIVVTGETDLAVYAPGYELAAADRQPATLLRTPLTDTEAGTSTVTLTNADFGATITLL